jgi:hypothetical protein
MNEENKAILKARIDEVIHYLWDPIGVSDAPSARDEYYKYSNKIWAMILEGKSEKDISDYLFVVRTETIGLPMNVDDDKEVAVLLFDWYDFLLDQRV